MKQYTRKCVLMFISSGIVVFIFTAQAFAVRQYYLSRPKLGFEVTYEYEQDKSTDPFVENDDKTHTLTERLDIETGGWFYHPALVEFDLTLSPQWEQIRQVRDDADTETSREFLEGYDAEFVFLQYKPYTVTLFGTKESSTLSSNFAETTRVETDYYGARLNLKYRVLPSVLNYSHYEETESGFINSFTEKDEVRLNMRYDEHYGNTIVDMIYIDLSETSETTESRSAESNFLSKEVLLQNIYEFPGARKMSLTSWLGYRDKDTDAYSERGVNWSEDLSWKHTRALSTDYTLRYESYDLEENKRRELQYFNFGLNHLLYENLTTRYYANASKNINEYGQEVYYRTGLDWNYIRKIPGGSINANMSHAYTIVDQRKDSDVTDVDVRDEIKTLSGNTIVFLNNENVDLNSIRVMEKRPDGLRGRTYEENVDYIINVIGDSTGMSRKPGTTTIPDGADVYVDYTYVSEPPFDYSVFDRSYGITLNLWNSTEMYYRYVASSQRFLRGTEPDTLNYYYSNIAGVEYRWRWSTTSFEYTDISASDNPTESWRAGELLVFRPTGRSFLSLSADVGETRFKELAESDNTEKFQNYRAIYEMMVSNRQRLALDAYLNKRRGYPDKTREYGIHSLYEWSYNIYKGAIEYTASNEKNMTTDATYINHLVMVTVKRELF